MSEDKLDFLDEVEFKSSREPEPEEPEQEQVEAQEAEAEPEPEPETEPEAEQPTEGVDEGAPPAPEKDDNRVPLSAMLDEREKRQKIERELEKMREQQQALQRMIQEREEKKPDFFENPEAALQAERQRLEAQMRAQMLQQSRWMAERDFGADIVNEAYAYFDEHPHLSHQFMNHPSPFHAAVEFYKKQKFVSEIGDPDEWRKAEEERIRQQVIAEASRPSTPKSPPPSMSKGTPAGTDAIAPGNAFENLFPE